MQWAGESQIDACTGAVLAYSVASYQSHLPLSASIDTGMCEMALDVPKSIDVLAKKMDGRAVIATIVGDLTTDIVDGGRERIGEVVLGFSDTEIGWARKLMLGSATGVVPSSDVSNIISATNNQGDPLLLVGFGGIRRSWGLYPQGGEQTADAFIALFEQHNQS